MATLRRADGVDLCAVEIAPDRRSRARGLIGRDGIEGALLIRPCRQVHTFRMRFAIDVAFCDGDGRVVHLVAGMPPRRVSRFVWRARGVLEAASGAFEGWGVRIGDVVSVAP